MNPRQIIMTNEEANHTNFAGISNKIEDVADSPVKEKFISTSRPRRSKNLASKLVDKFSPFIVVELMFKIYIAMDFVHPMCI